MPPTMMTGKPSGQIAFVTASKSSDQLAFGSAGTSVNLAQITL
jgi:hypothetical protein